MENNYFGILTEEMYNTLSEDEMKNFLIKNHLIQGRIPGTFIEDHKTNEKGGTERVIRFYTKNLVYKYSDKLVNTIFNFLNKYLVGSIETNLMMFNHNFDIKTYGYSKKKKTKEALKEFNSLFLKVCKKDQIGLGKDSNNNIGAEKRFVTLKKVQGGLIEKLKGEVIILNNYLYGNNGYFTRELIDSHPYLLEIFEFKNKLSILIDLNKKFQFEEDDIFTPKTKAKIIFAEHNDKFQSLKQVEFI